MRTKKRQDLLTNLPIERRIEGKDCSKYLLCAYVALPIWKAQKNQVWKKVRDLVMRLLVGCGRSPTRAALREKGNLSAHDTRRPRD